MSGDDHAPPVAGILGGPPVVVVSSTLPDVDTARSVARRLVESELAACAQVGAAVWSVYRWEGAVDEADEVELVCKTSEAALEACVAALVAAHPYDLPQVVVTLAGATVRYADWVRSGTGGAAAGGADGTGA